MSANEQEIRAPPRSCASCRSTNSVSQQTVLSDSDTLFDLFIDGFLVLLCHLLDQKCHCFKGILDVSAVDGCALFPKRRENGTAEVIKSVTLQFPKPSMSRMIVSSVE